MTHTTTSTMTDEQIQATFDAAWVMLENNLDYCSELEFCNVYNYWNQDRLCSEAWLTDGNCDMNAAVKYELLCSYRYTE